MTGVLCTVYGAQVYFLQCSTVCKHFPCLCSAPRFVNIFLVFAVLRGLWTFSLSLQCSTVCEHFPCLCSAPPFVNIFLVFAVLNRLWTFSLSLQCSTVCEHFPCLCSAPQFVNIFPVFAVLPFIWTFSLSLQCSVLYEHFPCLCSAPRFVNIFLAVSLFISFGLQLYVPVRIIWPIIEKRLISKRKKILGEYIFRTILVLLSGKFDGTIWRTLLNVGTEFYFVLLYDYDKDIIWLDCIYSTDLGEDIVFGLCDDFC